MLKRKIAFIVNPKSGTDRVKAIQETILTVFDVSNFDIEIIHTKYAGHATIIAQELAAKNTYSTIVAVGGDGTVNEVAKGLLKTNCALGIVPKGSGNGLARACSIPLNLKEALNIIANGKNKTIDIGQVNENIFLSNTGVGLDAAVALACKKQNKRGFLMYLKTTSKIFLKYSPKTYEVIIDKEYFTEKATMISIANGNEFGYGFKIAPTANLQDGLLDVMIIKPLNIFSAAKVSLYAWLGNLHKYNKVKHIHAKHIIIKSNNANAYQFDGDAIANNKDININILPQALKIIVP